MQDDDVTAATCSALLKSVGRVLNGWSMLAAMVTLLVMGLKHTDITLITSAVLGFFQAYFAARCAFDGMVFAALGGNETNYKKFDDLLDRRKARVANTAFRAIEDRAKGAIRLLRWQAICFLSQVVAMSVGLTNLFSA